LLVNVAGVVLLPAGAGGTILGGLLVEKLRLNIRQIFRIQIGMSCLLAVGCALFLLICDTSKFAGVTVPYNAFRSSLIFFASGLVFVYFRFK